MKNNDENRKEKDKEKESKKESQPFEVGDRVRLHEGSEYAHQSAGGNGTVRLITTSNHPYAVEWDNTKKMNDYRERDIVLVRKGEEDDDIKGEGISKSMEKELVEELSGSISGLLNTLLGAKDEDKQKVVVSDECVSATKKWHRWSLQIGFRGGRR